MTRPVKNEPNGTGLVFCTYPSPKTDRQTTSELSCDQYLSHTVNHTPNWNTCSRPSYSLLPPTSRAEGVRVVPVTHANSLPVIQFTCYTCTVYLLCVQFTCCAYIYLLHIQFTCYAYSLLDMRTNRLPVTWTVYLYNVPLKHTNYLLPVQTVLMLHVQTASLPVTHTNSHQDKKKKKAFYGIFAKLVAKKKVSFLFS